MALKDKYVTVSQAAKDLGVTRQTISRWIRKKYVPAEKVGRVVLIEKKELEKFRAWKISEDAADVIVRLYESKAEEVLREQGQLKEHQTVRVGADPKSKGYYELTPEQQNEVNKRVKPILIEILKEVDKMMPRMRTKPKK